MDLKEMLKSRSMTQTDLAEKIGVTQATISIWAAGKAIPSKEYADKIEKVLGKPDQDNFKRVCRISSKEAARLMRMSWPTFCRMAQQGTWDWCKASFTPSEKGGRWYYHINFEKMKKDERI